MEQMRELQNMDTSATAEKNSAVQTGKPAYANGNKVPNVPPLRFPEFTDEWAETTIGTIATVVGGGTPDTTQKENWDGDILWYTPSEIGKEKYVSNSARRITTIGLKNSGAKLLPKGTILLTSRATIGECSIALHECTTNQGFQSLIANPAVNNEFLFYLISSKCKELLKRACGSTFLEISANEVRKIKVKSPSIEEQNKIGFLLSLIDERIATQSKIIDKLQSLMSGIVVSHFNSCNTKSTISIKDLGEAYSVGNLSKDDLSEEGKPCILYGELFTTYGCVACEVQNRTNKYAQATLSRAGDLLFPASTTVDAISLIAPTSLQTDGVYVAGDMFGIHISPQYKSEYISYLLNYVYNRKLSKYAQGSTIIHLHYADVKNATIQVPCLEEQNKCAGLLEALQTKLDIAKQLIDCYQTQKSYLLQRMFI